MVPSSLMSTGTLAVESSVLKIMPRGWLGFYGMVKYKFFLSPLSMVKIYLLLPYSLSLKFFIVLLMIIAREWMVIIFEKI